MIVGCVQRGFTAHSGCILIVIRSNNCNSNFDINDKREELPNKHLAKLHINFILYHKKFPGCKFDDFFGRKLHDKGISVASFQLPSKNSSSFNITDSVLIHLINYEQMKIYVHYTVLSFLGYKRLKHAQVNKT